ncbi:MAG: MBL fold metallo-hydrolase [Heliobacteriaceae bacterium]|jgi:glyoxylase-like metal-dependent hydrolase (beta-lactamase superfamily II)|nr:MBL fold metallo-hydrolase [Heliobacteriaceae bacterium]
MIIVRRFEAGPIQANNYLVTDKESKEAVLIDCTEKNDEILDAVDDLGVKTKYILLTHGHFDHVLGVNEMKNALNAEVLIHSGDVCQLENTNSILSVFGFGSSETPKHDRFVNDGDELFIGRTKIKVIHTPGHTNGGVCYLIEDKLFSGDTLFLESVGRTDLAGGDFDKLENSVKNVLFKLDENITVYPGHGPETTIGHEKLYNEIL